MGNKDSKDNYYCSPKVEIQHERHFRRNLKRVHSKGTYIPGVCVFGNHLWGNDLMIRIQGYGWSMNKMSKSVLYRDKLKTRGCWEKMNNASAGYDNKE